MTTKKKAIIISIIATIMLIVVAVTIVLAVYFTRVDAALYARAREILSMTFTQSDLGEKADFKREINKENPLNLVNYYGDVTVQDMWKGIPDNQKPYTIILIIPGNPLMPGGEQALSKLESTADLCEVLRIPYVIQNINGETHMEARFPIAYLEKRFANHQYFYGLNAAELYNGIEWRGAAESDQTEYLIDCIKLCAKYGAYFIWTDTNRNYKNGMIIEYIEHNEALYNALLQYGDYVCMLNKESYGTPSTYAVMQGLWLSGLIGNWGVASDWWHWQVDEKKTLFDENNKAVDDEWEQIFSYPENMYVQSMMLVMSKGGTCFKAEAPSFSTTLEGTAIAGFQYGISPLFDRIISGEIKIPDRDTVFNETKRAILGGENWKDTDYNLKLSNLYPSYGDGISVLLPKNLRLAQRNIFLSKGIPLLTEMTDIAPKPLVNDNSVYLAAAGNNWYYINPSENERYTAIGNITPRVNSASGVAIKAEEHTSAIMNEQSGKLGFYISNYRTDKNAMITTLTKDNRGDKAISQIIAEYMLLDKDGNPKGVSDTLKRKVEIIINGSLDGGKPRVNISDMGANARNYTIEEFWDAANKQLRIVICMNGVLQLSVDTDDSGKELTYAPRLAIEDSLKVNDNNISALEMVVQQQIYHKEHFTYYSYLMYNKAFNYATMLISEKTGTEEQINKAVDHVNAATGNLTDMSKLIQRLGNFNELDASKLSTMSYNNAALAVDRALREMLSVKPYTVLRSSKLKYAAANKKFNKGDYKTKASRLESALKDLTKALSTLEIIGK